MLILRVARKAIETANAMREVRWGMRGRIGSGWVFCLCALSALGQQSPARQLAQSSHRTPLIISEIMYNPGVASVTSALSYIEIFNTEPLAQNVGGFALTGDVDYTFPTGTVLAARAFVVVAADPAAAAAYYGIATPYG